MGNQKQPGHHSCFCCFCFVTTIVLWGIVILSLIHTYSCGKGLVAIGLSKTSLAQILPIESIKSVAETVGFGSILLVWIYAVLDKQELGLRYSIILQAVCPAYPYFVLSHLMGILFCIWLSNADIWDGALLSLIIVFLDLIVHWRAMSLLVFHSNKRRQIAASEWEKRLLEGETDQTYLNELLTAASVLRLERDPIDQEMLQYFRKGLLRYAETIPANVQINCDQIQKILEELAQVWTELLRPYEGAARLILAGALLPDTRLKQDTQNSGEIHYQPLGAVYLGYVICLYRLYEEEYDGISIEERLWRIKQHLDVICLRCNSQAAEHYLLLSENLLAWVTLYLRLSTFNSKLFDCKPVAEVPGDKTIAQAMVDLLFQDSKGVQEIDFIYSQLFDSVSAQQV